MFGRSRDEIEVERYVDDLKYSVDRATDAARVKRSELARKQEAIFSRNMIRRFAHRCGKARESRAQTMARR